MMPFIVPEETSADGHPCTPWVTYIYVMYSMSLMSDEADVVGKKHKPDAISALQFR